MALKDQQKRGRVNLYGAHFPRVRARGAPSHRRRQWVPPINRSQRRKGHDSGWGRTLMLLLPPAARFSYGVMPNTRH
jgi:hypothetical protein